MTCYNRKEMTLKCIKALSKPNTRYSTSFYICDDASTDGTAESINENYPFVNLVKSPGNLYWCRGMYNAMKRAVDENHNFYLMVNDDVEFLDGAIEEMLDTYCETGENCGVVGYTRSKVDGSITYGGLQGQYMKIFGKNAGFIGQYFVSSTKDKLAACLLANWNCFLIDAYTVSRIGLIDQRYEHGIGDFDYSLMMNEAGIHIYVTRNAIGYCERNPINNTFQDSSLKRLERIKKLLSPKAYPVKSRYHYHIKHWGWVGAIYATLIYANFLYKILIGEKIY